MAVDKTKRDAANKAWKLRNPEKWSAIQRKHRLANPERTRVYHWRAAGIDETVARTLLDTHDGRCDLCNTNKPGGKGSWHVDHCHHTGTIRGVLCCGCNLVLGRVERIGADRVAVYLKGAK